MGCIIILLILSSPRLILFLYWMFNSTRFNAVFTGSFLWPLAGFLFAPWTTLMYYWAYNPVLGHLTGWGTFWVIIGILLDLASYGSTKYGRRGSTQPTIVE